MKRYQFSGYRALNSYPESAVRQGLISPTIMTISASSYDEAYSKVCENLEHDIKFIKTVELEKFKVNIPSDLKVQITNALLDGKADYINKNYFTSEILAYHWELMNGYEVTYFDDAYVRIEFENYRFPVNVFVEEGSICLLKMCDRLWNSREEADGKCMEYNRRAKLSKASYDCYKGYREYVTAEIPFVNGFSLSELENIIRIYLDEVSKFKEILEEDK